MKRFLLVEVVFLCAAACVTATPTVTIGRVDGTYPDPSVLLAGEFQLTPNSELAAILGTGAAFQSFCIEAYEPIVVGDTYNAALNIEAIQGDGRGGEPAGPGGGDLLSPETAYLYTQFRAGTLTGYNYTEGPGRQASALALQTAIWYLEGESTYTWLSLSPEAQDFVTLAQGSGWDSIHNVRILNLTGTDSNGQKTCYQDMLVMVPAPGALLIATMGAGFVSWLRRRRTL